MNEGESTWIQRISDATNMEIESSCRARMVNNLRVYIFGRGFADFTSEQSKQTIQRCNKFTAFSSSLHLASYIQVSTVEAGIFAFPVRMGFLLR